MKLQIMSPAADRVDYEVPPAPRLSSLEGKTVGPVSQHDRWGRYRSGARG